jgi:hypothetical protein
LLRNVCWVSWELKSLTLPEVGIRAYAPIMKNDAMNEDKSSAISSGVKRERFLRVAERRTTNVLSRLRVLGNCANKHAYEYDEEDVRQIFDAIDREMKIVRAKFETSGKPKFSFRDEQG